MESHNYKAAEEICLLTRYFIDPLNRAFASFKSLLNDSKKSLHLFLLLIKCSGSLCINPNLSGKGVKLKKVGEKACVSALAKDRCDERRGIAVVQKDI